MSAKVKETAVQEAERVRNLAEEGVKSGAYIYPIKVRASCYLMVYQIHRD